MLNGHAPAAAAATHADSCLVGCYWIRRLVGSEWGWGKGHERGCERRVEGKSADRESVKGPIAVDGVWWRCPGVRRLYAPTQLAAASSCCGLLGDGARDAGEWREGSDVHAGARILQTFDRCSGRARSNIGSVCERCTGVQYERYVVFSFRSTALSTSTSPQEA